METLSTKVETIKRCGEAAGATPQAMRKWFERDGVPGRWHLPILRVARERGEELSEDDLLLTPAYSPTPLP